MIRPIRLLAFNRMRGLRWVRLGAALVTWHLCAKPAFGEPERFLLGDTGSLGGWLITSNTFAKQGQIVLAPSDGSIDLGALFKPRTPASDAVTAQGTLTLQHPVDGWLLVRASGALRIRVDGKLIKTRASALAQGKGWEAVALHLSEGRHPIQIACESQRDPWLLAARFIDKAGQVPLGTEWSLPYSATHTGTTPEPFEVALDLAAINPPDLGVEIQAPVGIRNATSKQLTVRLQSPENNLDRKVQLSDWPRVDSTPAPLHVHLRTLTELSKELAHDRNTLLVDVQLGQTVVKRKLLLPQLAIDAWRALATALDQQLQQPAEPLDVTAATLQNAALLLTQAATTAREFADVEAVARRALNLANAVIQGHKPWETAGIHELAYRSTADGTLQQWVLHVPAQISDGQKRPLVMLLHGYNSNARRIIDAFLDIAPTATSAKVDGYVLAPAAHGNAFYRGPGERDVLDILDFALQALKVDKARISITGASMGGTGTAEIAFHYPDRFAALAPLCGYHSYFVRHDTAGQPLRGWERRLMHRFSPASSAESGQYMPMFLAHGLKDKPLVNSKVLTERYRSLGYDLTELWPDVGHAVWKRAWANGSLFPWLSQKQLNQDPQQLALAATTVRHAHDRWLQLVELDSSGEISRVNAAFDSANALTIQATGVRVFQLGITRWHDRTRPLMVRINGTKLSVPPGTPPLFRACPEHAWCLGSPSGTSQKRAHVEGPWSDLWTEPLVFVYGTRNPNTIAANMNVARALAAPGGGMDANYPVVSDTTYLSANDSEKTPIVVGNAEDNLVLASWQKKLPMVVQGDAIEFAGRRYTGDRLGAIYVYPNPDRPERIVGVITAPSPEGIWQALSLPVLLPDFMIFDARVAPAAGQPILGRQGKVQAAGYFEADWTVPKQLNDPVDES